MWITFSNWQPDLDPVTPGILVDPSDAFIPTKRGYRNSQGFYATSQQLAGANPTGLFYAMRSDGVNNLYAMQGTNVYVRSGSSWTIAVAAGVTVSAVATRFQFAQYGDLTFTGALETQPMVTDTTTFTSIAAMPRFATIDICNEFVMIGNVAVSVTYSDGFGVTMVTPGAYPDRWWCSGVGNPLTYAPSAATQAASGRLTDLPGPLTAGRALADKFVFYKQRGIWLGDYVGNPFVWEWSMISKEIGVAGPQCVVVVDNMHYFVGQDDFYLFDGQQVKSIGYGVRDWFFAAVARDYLYKTLGFVDRNEKLIYWGFVPVGSSSGNITQYIVVNYENGRWGRSSDFSANVVTEFYADPFTYDQLWAGLVWDSIPNQQFDLVAPAYKTYLPAFLRISDGAMVTMYNGAPQVSAMVTSWGGDDTNASLLRRVRMRWITSPTSATLTPYRLMRQGEVGTAGTVRTMQDARFDFTQNARWHKAKVNTIGSWETTGIDAEIYRRGRE